MQTGSSMSSFQVLKGFWCSSCYTVLVPQTVMHGITYSYKCQEEKLMQVQNNNHLKYHFIMFFYYFFYYYYPVVRWCKCTTHSYFPRPEYFYLTGMTDISQCYWQISMHPKILQINRKRRKLITMAVLIIMHHHLITYNTKKMCSVIASVLL